MFGTARYSRDETLSTDPQAPADNFTGGATYPLGERSLALLRLRDVETPSPIIAEAEVAGSVAQAPAAGVVVAGSAAPAEKKT